MFYARLLPLMFAVSLGRQTPLPERFVKMVQPLTLDPNVTDDDGFCIDRIAWSDARGFKRSAAMVHNDRKDPKGFWGGYLRTYTLNTPQGPRTCTGSIDNHPGFGYTVNHFAGGVASSRKIRGQSFRYVLRGAYHTILEQSWTYPIDAYPVTATVQWLFVSGRSHPLYAVTFDTSKAPKNAIKADTRAPYGDISWDGDASGEVDGVGWGDRYVFTTLSTPVTPNTPWDYTKPNTVPFTHAYSVLNDAEMGLVQTQTEDQHDAGGYDGYKLWRTRSRLGPMPQDKDWPYQLNQYELPYNSTSKRMAWGANYGAVGQTAYSSLGNERILSGYPYQSYSTFVVIGSRSRNEVANQIHDIETVQRTTLSVDQGGSVLCKGPGGVGRTDKIELDKPGFNPIYSSWEATYTGNGEPLALRFDVGGAQALNNALVVVHDWPGGQPSLTVNGKRLPGQTLGYASEDSASKTLWITLAEPLPQGSTVLAVAPQRSGQKSQGDANP